MYWSTLLRRGSRLGKGGWIEAFRADWRSAARSYRLVLDRRISNRLQDRRAVLEGACNASTWSEALVSFRGGYAHWRCGKAAGHKGWHRYINHRWPQDQYGRVFYDPLEASIRPKRSIDSIIPFQVYAEGRHMVPTARQERLMRTVAEANMILRRQERERAKEDA